MKKFLYTPILAALLASTPVIGVTLEPSSVAAATNPFVDVKDSNSHAEAIVALYHDGVLTGMTATSYQPGQSATRGDAALYLANALGLTTSATVNPGFEDVPTTSKYYNAVAALTSANIVKGYGEEFRPNQTLTRAQLAKMLTIGFELQQSTVTTTKFSDVNRLTDQATKSYIQTLVDYEITKGTTATTFSPNNQLTRGQLATFLFNAIQATSDEFTIISVE